MFFLVSFKVRIAAANQITEICSFVILEKTYSTQFGRPKSTFLLRLVVVVDGAGIGGGFFIGFIELSGATEHFPAIGFFLLHLFVVFPGRVGSRGQSDRGKETEHHYHQLHCCRMAVVTDRKDDDWYALIAVS